MNARTFARIATALALAAAGSAVQAAADNPLAPGFYIGKPARTIEVSGMAAAYVAADNPLAPSFYQGRAGTTFVGTAGHGNEIYRDLGNPLNPSHRFN